MRNPLVKLVNVGIVLPFPQTFIDRMAKLAVARPGTKLDLGDQRRMHPDNIGLSGIGHRRLLLLPAQLVQHLAQPGGLSLAEPCPDAANIDDRTIAVRAQQQRTEAGRQGARWLVADDEKCLARNALDLHPVACPTGSIGVRTRAVRNRTLRPNEA